MNLGVTTTTIVLRPLGLYRTTCLSRHQQSFTAHMPLLTATIAFKLGTRR